MNDITSVTAENQRNVELSGSDVSVFQYLRKRKDEYSGKSLIYTKND